MTCFCLVTTGVALALVVLGALLAFVLSLEWLDRRRERKHGQSYREKIEARMTAATWARQSAADPYHITREQADAAMREWTEQTQKAREDKEP